VGCWGPATPLVRTRFARLPRHAALPAEQVWPLTVLKIKAKGSHYRPGRAVPWILKENKEKTSSAYKLF